MKINISSYKKGVFLTKWQAQNETDLLNYLPPHLANVAILLLKEGKVFEFSMLKLEYKVERVISEAEALMAEKLPADELAARAFKSCKWADQAMDSEVAEATFSDGSRIRITIELITE